jgi:hypothetical protein
MAWATATVLAVAAIAASAAGAGAAAYGQYQQGKAQESAAKFNAAVQQNNALASKQQAQYEADRIRKRNLHLRGAQNAAIAKSGIDVSGSASDVIYDSAMQGEMDALAALYTGKVRSNAEASGAMLSRLSGENARTSSYYSMAGSILGGASGAASSGYGYANNPRLS